MTQPPDFERVYADQSGYVRRILLRMGIRETDVDDVVQDAFVTIFRLLPGFEGRATLETWLYAVCWRVAAQYHRRVRPRDAGVAIHESSFSIDAEFGAARVMASLEGVEPRDLDVFVLHEIGGLSISELSEMTGKARATLRRHVDRARSTIQRALRRDVSGRTSVVRASRPPRPRADLPRTYVNSDVCIAQHVNTVLVRWRGPSAVEYLEMLFDVLRRAVAETSERLTFISVIEPEAPPPDADGRAVIRRCMEEIGPRLAAAAFLALGAGVFALVPPVINACLFLSRTPINIRFFSDQRLALDWLSPFLTGGATRDGLANQMAEMPRLLDEAELMYGPPVAGRAAGPARAFERK